MSEIPFVNQLGDAIQTAVTTPSTRTAWFRRRRPVRGAVVIAALIGLGGGVALASGLLTSSSPVQLATSIVTCFPTASLASGVEVTNGDLLPVPACEQTRRQLGEPAVALVACADTNTPGGFGDVAVFPGDGPEACNRPGLGPLPASYYAELTRVTTLQNRLVKLQASAICTPPAKLAAEIQRLLERTGWTGWHPRLIDPGPEKGQPCGSVEGLTGGGGPSIEGSLNAPTRSVLVFAFPYPSTLKLLEGSRSGANSLGVATGKACYDQTTIRELVRRWLGQSNRTVRYTASQPPTTGALNDGRQARLAAGCAVIAGVEPAPDGYNLVVQIWQRAPQG